MFGVRYLVLEVCCKMFGVRCLVWDVSCEMFACWLFMQTCCGPLLSTYAHHTPDTLAHVRVMSTASPSLYRRWSWEDLRSSCCTCLLRVSHEVISRTTCLYTNANMAKKEINRWCASVRITAGLIAVFFLFTGFIYMEDIQRNLQSQHEPDEQWARTQTLKDQSVMGCRIEKKKP